MKKIILRVCIAIVTLVVLLALGVSGWFVYIFKDQYQALSSIHQVAPDFYEMTFRGDYGVNDFIAQGGVRSDADLAPFLQQFLSHGLMPAAGTEVNADDFGCSTLCAPMRGESGFLFGRNFDWERKGETIVVRTFPKDGYASISTSKLDFFNVQMPADTSDVLARMPILAAIYVPLDGINEKGLCVADLVAVDTLKTAQERGNLSVTTTTAIRLLLDKAATTQEAIQLLSSWDMHSSINWAHHLAISDASGESVVVEWVNNEMQVIPSAAVTNHYLSPLRENVGVGNTFARRDSLCSRLDKLQTMAVDDMKELLKDVSFDDYTDWSIIFNTSNLSATYYLRTDYNHPYVFSLK